jgi:hypothetical protein
VLVTMSVVSRLASRWLMKSFDVEDGKCGRVAGC